MYRMQSNFATNLHRLLIRGCALCRRLCSRRSIGGRCRISATQSEAGCTPAAPIRAQVKTMSGIWRSPSESGLESTPRGVLPSQLACWRQQKRFKTQMHPYQVMSFKSQSVTHQSRRSSTSLVSCCHKECEHVQRINNSPSERVSNRGRLCRWFWVCLRTTWGHNVRMVITISFASAVNIAFMRKIQEAADSSCGQSRRLTGYLGVTRWRTWVQTRFIRKFYWRLLKHCSVIVAAVANPPGSFCRIPSRPSRMKSTETSGYSLRRRHAEWRCSKHESLRERWQNAAT
mmetsp:Transcript_49152/g.117089  ORF Transcript_49152/g.117089 Transcript_49152/m.117089 type:complete len:287 (+) Transcript_49152:2123-2983(+)